MFGEENGNISPKNPPLLGAFGGISPPCSQSFLCIFSFRGWLNLDVFKEKFFIFPPKLMPFVAHFVRHSYLSREAGG